MPPITIRTHYQIPESEREYTKRKWVRGNTDRSSRHEGWTNHKRNGHHAFGPHPLLPSIPSILSTISASIVWGICGQMADMPEY